MHNSLSHHKYHCNWLFSSILREWNQRQMCLFCGKLMKQEAIFYLFVLTFSLFGLSTGEFNEYAARLGLDNHIGSASFLIVWQVIRYPNTFSVSGYHLSYLKGKQNNFAKSSHQNHRAVGLVIKSVVGQNHFLVQKNIKLSNNSDYINKDNLESNHI